MDDDDLVLSDVHVGSKSNLPQDDLPSLNRQSSSGSQIISFEISRFEFKLPTGTTTVTKTQHPALEENVTIATDTREDVNYDSDGDIKLERNMKNTDVITIEHGLASPLSLVGLQVWSGALLLSDYLLHIYEQLLGNIVLELGAGSGLSSIIASKFAQLTICTDTNDEVLQLCQNNVDRNTRHNKIIVRDLDWCSTNPYQTTSKWSWTDEDLQALNKTNFIIAADVIYSDALTDSLFNVLKQLLLVDRPITVIISLEKRLNFTLEELEVCCPAYEHFVDWTRRLTAGQPSISVSQLNTEFPQSFQYEKTKYLEIWKFTN